MEKTTKHPAFGIARFSKGVSSNAHPLFGSSINHSHTITLQIFTGVHERTDYASDHYFDDKLLVEIEMSHAQLSELITSFNYGTGVPVTLRYYNGKKIEDLPVLESKRAQHVEEFKEKMKDFVKYIENKREEIKEYLKKPKLPKKDKEEIEHLLDMIEQNVKQNIPFYQQQFEEQIDKTMMEAKAELDAFLNDAVKKEGLEAIKNKMIE